MSDNPSEQVGGIMAEYLGPCIGATDSDSTIVWLHKCDMKPGETERVFLSLERLEDSGSRKPHLLAAGKNFLNLTYDTLNTGLLKFENLQPNTRYYYTLWHDIEKTTPVDLGGLNADDLHFTTFPTGGFNDRLEFLLMSCHNPTTATGDGADGFAVWATMPSILKQNKNVRFALLAGDQVYADSIAEQARAEPELRPRQDLYLSVYKKFWSNIHYRRVLCSLPAVLMWDDHDITDGWGSDESSYENESSKEFKKDWQRMFEAAKSVFGQMQASRNFGPLEPGYRKGFDTCFRIGTAGFVVPDLRSHRKTRDGKLWDKDQFDAIARWVKREHQKIETLFFVSPVVFSHGDPKVDEFTAENWPVALQFIRWLATKASSVAQKIVAAFDKSLGDIRDDINDSWGAKVNNAEADRVLDFLFGLQNPTNGENAINVVILSGDIHTPGYSTIYSNTHKNAVIPHIVASPVSYEPFSWIVEAIYRHLTKNISIGAKGSYTAQISHHFCHRNVVVMSLRRVAASNKRGEDSELHLKVKYYLEGFPEPQIMLFDLRRSSHREAIEWPQKAKAGAPSPA